MISDLHPIPFNPRHLKLQTKADAIREAGPPSGACGVGTNESGGRNLVGIGGINQKGIAVSSRVKKSVPYHAETSPVPTTNDFRVLGRYH